MRQFRRSSRAEFNARSDTYSDTHAADMHTSARHDGASANARFHAAATRSKARFVVDVRLAPGVVVSTDATGLRGLVSRNHSILSEELVCRFEWHVDRVAGHAGSITNGPFWTFRTRQSAVTRTRTMFIVLLPVPNRLRDARGLEEARRKRDADIDGERREHGDRASLKAGTVRIRA